jgi:hypothetical protein
MDGCVEDKSGDVGDVDYMLHADEQESDSSSIHSKSHPTLWILDSCL